MPMHKQNTHTHTHLVNANKQTIQNKKKFKKKRRGPKNECENVHKKYISLLLSERREFEVSNKALCQKE